jgi:hypothetical protein
VIVNVIARKVSGSHIAAVADPRLPGDSSLLQQQLNRSADRVIRLPEWDSSSSNRVLKNAIVPLFNLGPTQNKFCEANKHGTLVPCL